MAERKNVMRNIKRIALVSTLSCMVLLGCGRVSPEAQVVIDKIESIGVVDYDDEVLIGECEDAYLALTTEQQEEVKNFDKLSSARVEMDKLLEAKPLPFSYANWQTTRSELIDLMGKQPDEEYDTDEYHILQYNDCDYDDYSGLTRYCFVSDRLVNVHFIFGAYDEKIESHFYELYKSKYGEPDFDNEFGKVWYTNNANVSVSGTRLFGGFVQCVFHEPTNE